MITRTVTTSTDGTHVGRRGTYEVTKIAEARVIAVVDACLGSGQQITVEVDEVTFELIYDLGREGARVQVGDVVAAELRESFGGTGGLWRVLDLWHE